MSTKHAQALGRAVPKRVPCEGSHAVSTDRLDPDRGRCPGCGEAKLTYDSNRRGRGLLVDHDRPAHEG